MISKGEVRFQSPPGVKGLRSSSISTLSCSCFLLVVTAIFSWVSNRSSSGVNQLDKNKKNNGDVL